MYKVFDENLDIFLNKDKSKSFIYEEKDCLGIVNKIKEYLNFNNIRIILLEGDLGSGKTTFSRTFINSYNNEFIVTSPTYNYVNSYKINDDFSIYHFDLYRLKDISSLEDLGFYELANNNACLCIIEWPEFVKKYLDENLYNYLLLKFNHNNSENRIMTI